MNYNHEKKCLWCKQKFYSQRKDAKFCSSTCRVHFHNYNKQKYAINETFDDDVSKITLNDLKVLSVIARNEVYTNEELKFFSEHKDEFFKLFLLAHRDKIYELIFSLNLFSEEEFATITNFASKAIEILIDIEIDPGILPEKMEEIKKLTYDFEHL